MSTKYISGLLITATLALTTSCLPKTDVEKPKDVSVDLGTIKLEDLTASLDHAGGQPGKITVSGVVVSEDNAQLDERISIVQTPGKSSVDWMTVNIAPAQKAVMIHKASVIDFKSSSKDSTYFNLNCSQIDPEWVTGLTEIKEKPIKDGGLILSADTIIICKNAEIAQMINLFTADHIILVNANLKAKGPFGQTSLQTNKLTLIGKNKITTSGVDGSYASIFMTSDIKLTVAEEIHGEGTLELISIGGNNIKTEEKK